MLDKKNYFVKILNYKNNTFISVCDSNGVLLACKSFMEKKTKDIKSKMTLVLINLLKKLKLFKMKYINLNINNINKKIIQHTFSLFKTFNLTVNSIKYFLSLPHNGCRKTRKNRKRNKKRRKSKKLL